MDELIGEFLSETAESLDTIDAELVRFETNPTDRSTLDNIFRLLHTIKGTCGFLGLERLEAIAHAGETLLGKFRDGDLVADSAAVTVVLHSVDRIKSILDGLEATGSEPQGDDRDLIDRLEALSEGRADPQAGAPASEPEPQAEPETEAAAEAEEPVSETPVSEDADGSDAFDEALGRPLRPGEVSLAELEAAFAAADGPELYDEADEAEDAESADDAEDEAEPVAATVEAAASAAKEARAANAEPGADQQNAGVTRAPSSIRVSVDVLESLMTTVSELVLARNQLHQLSRENEDSSLKTPLQRLSSVTAELQDGVMKTRMQPVGDAWRKLPRIVRDACQDLDKKIDFVTEGEDTELDRQVLELIKDPLTHMVRNSADHGVETPQEREAAGKPAKGTIRLSAYHEGGAIIIKIADDGKGLDPAKLRAKALEKGLTTEEELAHMSEAQIQRFIFMPGFSTAAAVTNLSGRGVGMDVVRTNIEQIGGSIDLTSEVGKGTTFAIKIPLTLAIVSALIVKSGEARFAVPQLSVRELVRVGENSDHAVEKLNGARMIRLRERLLPVIGLREVLGTGGDEDAELSGYVIVLEAAGRKVGLVVDDVLDTEEIVVKPLSGPLRGIRAYSGATLLGDGSVIMILDPNGVAQEIAHAEEEETTSEAEIADAARRESGAQRLLLVRAGGTEPKAVPVSLITRLEEFDCATIERAHDRHVVQYRGRLLPLAHASGADSFPEEGRQPVLVFSEEGRSAGVAVDEILDVVEVPLDLQMGSERPGVIGSAIIKEKATEVLDIAWHMERAWSGGAQRAASSGRRAILLVEADAFARRMMAPLLAAAGYDVTVAGNLHEARDAAQMGAEYAAIVGDPSALSTLAAEGFWTDTPRLGVSDDGYAGGLEGLAAVMRRSDRGGLIAAIDRASQGASPSVAA